MYYKDPNWEENYRKYMDVQHKMGKQVRHLSFRKFGMNWGIWHYDLEKDFAVFENLESIDLSYNFIDTVIINFSELKSLKEVDLSHNALYYWGQEGSFIIDQQINAPNLEKLNLSYGQAGNIIISQKAPFLDTLQWIDLSGNHFTDYYPYCESCPPRLQLPKLPNLKYLGLRENNYTSVPKLRYLPSIETLDLSRNRLLNNFEELLLLPNLKNLELNDCGLMKVPKAVLQMVNLKTLSIINNRITDIESIFNSLPNCNVIIDSAEN